MNILTDYLPTELTICGEKCPIKSDFRTWIKFTQIISSSSKADISAFVSVIRLVFDKFPPRFEETITAMMEFYNPPKQQSNGRAESNRKRVYDFDYDAELIYAAFLQQYKIDLCTQNMHWWQFKALFNNLTEDTQFVKVMQYRAMDLSRIKDKEQRKFYGKMKRIYKLPDNRTEEEKEQEMLDVLSASFM